MVNLIKTGLFMLAMKQSRQKTASEMEVLQEKKLLELISYARKYVPYYKNLKPINGIEELPSIPFTTKANIRDRPDQFISVKTPKNKLKKTATSGSSGIPISVYFNKDDLAYRLAIEYHQLTEIGIGPLDTQIHITHKVIKPNFLQKLGVFKHHYLSMYENESHNLDLLGKLKPTVLHAFPSVLTLLAQENLNRDRQLNIRRVLPYGEVLSQNTRKLISDSFGCQVHDIYGAMEIGLIAWEDAAGIMHINADSVIVEAVDDNGNPVKQGKQGNAVITALWPRAMPLIRYHIGDKIILGANNTIKSIEGRDDDFITLSDGSLVSPRILPCALVDVPGIKQYQIIQNAIDNFTFRFVRATDFHSEEVAKIFKKHLGDNISIEFEEVGDLPKQPSGKCKKVISKL